MSVPLFTVDAFTSRPFGGNSAGVVLLDAPAGEGWMQALAAELGQATTAFLAGSELRWFTAEAELPLCGHATLATVHVLSETGRLADGESVVLASAAGPLTGVVEDGRVWLDLPSTPLQRLDDHAATAAAVGLGDVVWSGASDYEHVLIAASADAVRELAPDREATLALPVERVIVTAAGGQNGADVTSRVFPPRSGLDEDAVTGSAHAVLGPLWAERLGRSEWHGHQASARGGEVAVRVAQAGRTLVGGPAVTISRGELAAAPA